MNLQKNHWALEHTRRYLIAGSIAIALTALGVGTNLPSITDSEPWIASSRTARKKNPAPTDPVSMAIAKKLYKRECASCHGDSGRGDGKSAAELDPRPTDLTTGATWAQTDGELYWKITGGRTPMPAFKDLMSDQERWLVVNYVRTLAPKPDVMPPRFDVPKQFRAALSDVMDPYHDLHTALAGNNPTGASAAAAQLLASVQRVKAIDTSALHKTIGRSWTSTLKKLESAAKALSEDTDPVSTQENFAKFSRSMVDAITRFGHTESVPLRIFASPTSDGDPARFWLQHAAQPLNPYGDASSLKSGDPVNTIAARVMQDE